MQYQADNGNEPTAQQLSAYLAAHGQHGRGQTPISPAHLRRYLLPYRIYTIWAQHRQHDPNPPLQAITQECATHHITAQYNKPLTPDHIEKLTADFERRWHTLHTHPTTEEQ
ncbi:hypothetical protein [Streptomyces sp. NPDC047043]|uniref:hypothetical protein n=1 Tax=Streptomyces sp. NPDC047043 TaxID=3154497 RepID=UPI0033EF6603